VIIVLILVFIIRVLFFSIVFPFVVLVSGVDIMVATGGIYLHV
jgi:hypothetical protein